MKKVETGLFFRRLTLIGLLICLLLLVGADKALAAEPSDGGSADFLHMHHYPHSGDTNKRERMSGCFETKAEIHEHDSNLFRNIYIKDLTDPDCFPPIKDQFHCYDIAFDKSSSNLGKFFNQQDPINQPEEFDYVKTWQSWRLGCSDSSDHVGLRVCDSAATKLFFTIPSWNRGLPNPDNPNCAPLLQPEPGSESLINQEHTNIILANVIDIFISLAALVAFGVIIYGGFLFIVSQGVPQQTAAALQTVINALIGLTIALIAKTVVEMFLARLQNNLRNVDDLQAINPDAALSSTLGFIFLILASTCVIMCGLQGLKYVMSGGGEKAKEALNGLIYAAIGIIVSIGSWAIVFFVVERMIFTTTPTASDITNKVLGVVIFVVAAAAVISIIIGGFGYVYSGGNSDSARAAQNRIIYGVIGLVVAIMSAPLTMWVLSQL